VVRTVRGMQHILLYWLGGTDSDNESICDRLSNLYPVVKVEFLSGFPPYGFLTGPSKD
jgi:hypothetical protein